jgi:predicted GTPase
VNDASGGDLRVGDDLQACTQDVAVSNRFQVDDRDILLFDTPGFDDTELSDTEILKRISGFLTAS